MNASIPTSQRQVCVLYADISGSQRLFHSLNEAEAMQAFERCFNRMERAISSFNGRVVKHIGEQLMAVFDTAEDAMRAACEMQVRVEKLPQVSGIRLAVGIAFHYGIMSEGGNDSTGDTVKVASRLVKLAKGGQVLATSPTIEALPDTLRKCTLALESACVRLHGEPIPVHAIVWQTLVENGGIMEGGLARNPLTLSEPIAANTADAPRLRLTHNGREFILSPEKPVATLGRDARCDLLIHNPHASRNHCRIELRRHAFILTDKSTNGTHVVPDAEPGFLLKGSEFVLIGRGSLSFGLLAERELDDIVTYETL
ncbi:MAG: adenylate/guanylate cyclase domain-containing protein [Sterolibacterium sp.]|jgi:class 3 adenylate cyclase|nr:adenylate/guanylate cyclase domain-containing protein [Sterolibacterium sp.]